MANITESQLLEFNDKIITSKDVLKIAKIVSEAMKKERGKYSKYINFSALSDDGASFQSNDLSIFKEDSVIHTRRIKTIKMRFFNTSNDKKIDVVIKHGDAAYVVVEGTDSVWVGGYLKQISDIFNAMKPQVNMLKNNLVIANILLLLGYSMVVVF